MLWYYKKKNSLLFVVTVMVTMFLFNLLSTYCSVQEMLVADVTQTEGSWNLCVKDLPKDKRNICFECERKRQENKETEIWKLIIKEPWIGWNEANKVIKCDEFEFDIVKDFPLAYAVENNSAIVFENEILVKSLSSGGDSYFFKDGTPIKL